MLALATCNRATHAASLSDAVWKAHCRSIDAHACIYGFAIKAFQRYGMALGAYKLIDRGLVAFHCYTNDLRNFNCYTEPFLAELTGNAKFEGPEPA